MKLKQNHSSGVRKEVPLKGHVEWKRRCEYGKNKNSEVKIDPDEKRLKPEQS